MTKTSRTIPIAIATLVALLVLPASALAEYLVPEGNSAVTQYTEGFPTGGGEKKAGSTAGKATPAQAIGARNAKKLADHGSEGAEVAEVAAETAPAQVEPSEPSNDQENGSGQSHPQEHMSGGDRKPAKHGQTQGNGTPEEGGGTAPATTSSDDGPGGSSGLGEILAAATGSSSSGGLGLLLPLAILAALAWGLIFFFRQRKQTEPPATAKP
jgi:hypothetical protein